MSQLEIQICMLTGDKLETAENIARSCNLIQKHSETIYINSEDVKILESDLHKNFQQVFSSDSTFCILLTGESLKLILKDRSLSQILLYLIL